jgi:AcrR family transcriptional regulator
MARHDSSSERKTQILDTAAVVFARKGFHQARVDDIVQESGLSKGTIYWYFKSKNDIITALSQRMLDQEIDSLYALLDAGGTVRERLLSYTRHVIDEVHQLAESGLLPIFYEFYALAARNSDKAIRLFIRQYLENTRTALAPLIQQGIECGELRPLDAEAAAMALAAQFEGCILIWAVDPEGIHLDDYLLTSVQLHIDSLSADSSHPHTNKGE